MKKLTIKRETQRSRTVKINFEVEYEDFEVKIGDGATIRYYSDRKACTIIDIDPKGRWIKVQEDFAKRIDNNGMSDFQEYEYSRNPNGRIHTFIRTRKNPNVYTDNGKFYDWGTRLFFGFRNEYFDYTF